VAIIMRSGSGSMRKTWIRPRVTSRPVGMEVTMYLPAEL
jgi:coenzyme PQQ precursor peptide PqqA